MLCSGLRHTTIHIYKHYCLFYHTLKTTYLDCSWFWMYVEPYVPIMPFCLYYFLLFGSLNFSKHSIRCFVVSFVRCYLIFFLAQNPKRSLNKTCCLSKICLRECSVYASWEQHKPISNVNKRKANGKNWIDLLGALLASVFIHNICEQALSVYVVFIKYIFKKAATSKMLINYLFIHKHTGAKLWLHVNVYSIRIEAFF